MGMGRQAGAKEEGRFIRALPGRIRLSVQGLKGNLAMVRLLRATLSICPGVEEISPSAHTGRMLILFNEQEIGLGDLLARIEKLETAPSEIRRDDGPERAAHREKRVIGAPWDQAAAAAGPAVADRGGMGPAWGGFTGVGRYPALVLSAAGLGILAVKRVFMGKSAWAEAPALFCLAALVAVLRDYPPARRQVEDLPSLPGKGRHDASGRGPWFRTPLSGAEGWRGEAMLGAVTLGLALVRENLVVLAGIALIQYLHRQIEQSGRAGFPEEWQNSPEKAYASRVGKPHLALAAGAVVLSGQPSRGLGVLLAGSPRVATVPARYAWEQAQWAAEEKGCFIPEHISLARLAQVKQVVLTDSALLRQGSEEEIRCSADPENEDEVWRLAASLMKRVQHPWLEKVLTKAAGSGGTLRTAFKVERGVNGVKGTIRGSEVLLGSLEYLLENGVDCDSHLVEIRRLQRAGHQTLCLARDFRYLGVLMRYKGGTPTELAQGLKYWRSIGIKTGVLNNTSGLSIGELRECGIDEILSGTTSDNWEMLAVARERGEEVLFVGRDEEGFLAGVPLAAPEKITALNRSLACARSMKPVIARHFRVAKFWNYAGMGLAALGVITAPMAKLVTDALTLALMAESKRAGQIVSGESVPLRDVEESEAARLPKSQAEPSGWVSGTSGGPAGRLGTPNTAQALDGAVLSGAAGSSGKNGPSGTAVLSDAAGPPGAAGSPHAAGVLGAAGQPDRAGAPPTAGASDMTGPSDTAERWYCLSTDEVLHRFAVAEDRGLSPQQVEVLRKQYGLNHLEPKKPRPWLVSYLAQFTEFTTLIVLGTSVMALITGAVFDGLAMGAILLANAAIGTLQERKAERVIEALNQFQPPSCRVVREGQEVEVVGTELVPGDVVRLEAGDRVPADLRLLQSWNLEVNESALSGESLPVGKNPQGLSNDCPLAEQTNMLFMGTDVTRGKGSGVVVGTGMQTEIGHLMSLMKNQDVVSTPLHEKVTGISKMFVKGAALAGTLVFVVGLLRGRPLTEMITTSITLAASAVPEGLPVTITIALSAGIYRMAKHHALIRKLSALETLGRTTVICTDKTGTLTKNEMTVTRIVTANRTWKVTGEGYEPSGEIVRLPLSEPTQSRSPDLERLTTIALLCNNSRLEREADRWVVRGDPTEGALLTLAAKAGVRVETMEHWHRVHEVPFDSKSGTMSVVCRDTRQDTDCFVFCKGSVETVLQRCSHYQEDGVIYPMTEAKKELIYRQNEKLASDALRVLGFAYCPTDWVDTPEPGPALDDELIYVGLVGMMDPAKPEVEASIREAYALGVKPVMITGDHPVTALAIARELGLGADGSRVMTGQELDGLSERDLAKAVEQVDIFARVTPEHKLRIVKAYQKAGHIVAMTGDGVNDTPAIKQSNTGIAMGGTGTEVTKATADMVLKKDHFGAILEGVKEGRTIIANMRRAIGCLLTGNLAEILVTATAVIAGLPMPLVPIQILLMNLLTDAIPAMILAVNPGNTKQYTKRQDIVDRNLYRKVVTRGLLLGAGALGLFGLTLSAGAPLAVAQTVAFTTLVLGQLGQTFSWHQEGSSGGVRESVKDRYLVGSLAASFLALVGTIYIPPVAGFFHTAPLQIRHWFLIFLLAGTVSLLAQPFLSLMARAEEEPSGGQAGGELRVLPKVGRGDLKGGIPTLMAGK
ncbi:P-type ATPase, transmembrane domain protein [Acididesulfobacillus acetoxydans]|uniref:Calcium-transporting ATPase n=2 Tax=Acididesulfobacillus acetoxydans TaxID=1561005 RepID=A0A8S0Y282_9FIRM|nr:P-type ATPase, transmembrane domain protein [Acididesulfobacillus acetoxydans]CEJ06589.1 Calcium-transporting ATPase [Acididesulfobacillus acetoxydans]